MSKRFGELTVLDDVSARIDHNEVVAILGPSGSGKSTLCRCINGLEPVDCGSVHIMGQPLPQGGKELTRLRSRVGMVFQQFNLFPHRCVIDNITLAPVLVQGLEPDVARERALTLLDQVGLRAKANSLPHSLSGGQQQRVAIARALAMEPSVMLFDEPTSALDPETIHEVLSVMNDLARQGTTMIVVTHEMSFARRAANRVIFMDRGSIAQDTSPAAFFDEPATDRAREFLSRLLDH